MSKTLLMTTLTLAAFAAAAIPTASACTFPNNEVLTYAVCYVPGATVNFAEQEAGDAQAFAEQEADDTVAFVQETVGNAPLP